MPAKDLGTKYICFKCGTKFYDLKKGTPVCPKCGTDQRESPALKAPPSAERRQRPPARPVPARTEEVEAEAADLEEDAEEDTEEIAAEDDET